MRTSLVIVAVLGLPSLIYGVPGDTLFSSDMDSGAAWTVNASSADTSAVFGFDYSSMGIPPSPNGGGSTLGLRMAANIASPATVEEIVATPTGFSVTGVPYRVEFDMWINVNGPFPGGGAGSTEFLGGGVGYNGTSATRNGALLIVDGEGGSGTDWRLYKNTGQQFVASGQYDVDTNNNSGVDLSAYFPGQMAPAFQQGAYIQQTGTLADGTGGFAWHHMVITVDPFALGVGVTSDLGLANFTVSGLSIGTIDNSNGGTVVAMEGAVEVMYSDLFTSVSDNPDLSFGLIDNFVVTEIPEPASLALLAVGVLAAVRRRG